MDRRFPKLAKVDSLRDFIEVQQAEAGTALGTFELATTYPRKILDDHGATIASLGLSGQCAIRVQITDP